MKEFNNCKIVQDLLPNYIEKLTNEETNIYIEEHLKECEECRNMLNDMKNDFKVKIEKRDNREVKYIKKYNNKMKILKSMLLIILIVVVLAIGRRTFIMTSLSDKANSNQKIDNYYAKLYSYKGDSLTITESYNNGEDYLTIMTSYVNGEENLKLTYYKKGNEKLFVSEKEGKKYILNSEGVNVMKIKPVTYVSNGLLESLQYAFVVGIDKTYCNGKKCYILRGNSYERYIDSETGVAVRSIEKSTQDITRETDTLVDYEYKFNVVSENDIVKPNIN